MSQVIVRFAPSPTGYLHVGNARAAIFNWLFARHHGGQFLLRIEDTDRERSKDEFLDSIVDSLTWLGLDWDQDPVFQSKRAGVHVKQIKNLIDQGQAYFCQCTPEELDSLRGEAKRAGKAFTYPGTCRDLNLNSELGQLAVRLKVPETGSWLEYKDLIRGTVKFPREQIDDFIIARTDGSPTYNFCVAIDDNAMAVTHVIRGEDHISNTPKQLALYQILGFKAPTFAHLPMVLSPTGGRLSKRDGAVSVQDYRLEGFMPEAMLNYLVRLGWSHGDQEIFSKDELIKLFDLDNVGKKGAVFDRKKLEWFGGHYIRQADTKTIKAGFDQISPNLAQELEALWPEGALDRLIPLYAERAVTLSQISQPIKNLANAPDELDLELCKKWLSDKTKHALEAFLAKIDSIEHYKTPELLEAAKESCQEQEIKLVALAQPLRLALTGSVQSPGVFELIELLSKDDLTQRVKKLTNSL